MFKRNSIKILSSLAVAGVLLTACSKTPSTEQAGNAQADHSLEQVKKNGVLRVAVFADDPPFGFVDSAGNNQGFDVALAKRVTKDLLGDEKKVEFIVTEASNRVEFLKSNRADVVFATFTVTPER